MLLLTAPTTSIDAQLARQQLEGIDVNHRLPVLAAEHGRNFRAVDHRNLIADLELRQIVKLGFVQAFALYRDQRRPEDWRRRISAPAAAECPAAGV